MIKITSVRDPMNVKRNATNVSLAKCLVGRGGKIFDCDI
jgi:hypothetical protein